MPLRRPLPLLLAIAALATAAGARADVVVAPTATPTPIAAGQRVVVFSSYDAAAKNYRLAIREHGTVTMPDVAPNPVPFDVDVGPTPSGHAYLVYSRCPSGGGTPFYALPPADC